MYCYIASGAAFNDHVLSTIRARSMRACHRANLIRKYVAQPEPETVICNNTAFPENIKNDCSQGQRDFDGFKFTSVYSNGIIF